MNAFRKNAFMSEKSVGGQTCCGKNFRFSIAKLAQYVLRGRSEPRMELNGCNDHMITEHAGQLNWREDANHARAGQHTGYQTLECSQLLLLAAQA